MGAGIVTAITVVVLVVVALAKAVVVVPQRKAGLIERLGRYRRQVGPGLSMMMPFVDRARIVATGEQTLNLGPWTMAANDSTPIETAVTLQVEVVDPVLATYEIEDYRRLLTELAERAVRDTVERLGVDEVPSSRDELQRALDRAFHGKTAAYGVQVGRITLEKFQRAG